MNLWYTSDNKLLSIGEIKLLKYLEELLAKYPNFYQIFTPIIISVILFIFKIPQKFAQHYLQKHKKRKDIFKNKQYIQDNVYLKREMEIQ